jgi:hypothetical protein
MAATPSYQEIQQALRRLQKKNPGVEYQVLRASNGEVAIMPKKQVDILTGKVPA